MHIKSKDKKALSVAFSALFSNLSAGWLGAAFITPNFVGLSVRGIIWILMGDISLGILCLGICFKLERSIL